MFDNKDPGAVVAAFIWAMNAWELRAWQLSRVARDSPDPESSWQEIRVSLDVIFDEYCTARERPHGRQATFQNPPEYDPSLETIIRVDIRGNSAFVETERDALLGGGIYQYALRKRRGLWLIDLVKRKEGNRWVHHIL